MFLWATVVEAESMHDPFLRGLKRHDRDVHSVTNQNDTGNAGSNASIPNKSIRVVQALWPCRRSCFAIPDVPPGHTEQLKPCEEEGVHIKTHLAGRAE